MHCAFVAISREATAQEVEAVFPANDPDSCIRFVEEMSGFSPFYLAGLYQVLLGPVSASAVAAYPILGTILHSAQQLEHQVFLCWYPTLFGIRVGGAVVDRPSFQPCPGSSVEIDSGEHRWTGRTNGQGSFLVDLPWREVTRLTLRSEGVSTTVEAPPELYKPASRREEGFVEELDVLAGDLLRGHLLSPREAEDNLRAANRLRLTEKFLARHPVGLNLLFAASERVRRMEVERFALPLETAGPPEPAFPAPQLEIADQFLLWELPLNLLEAVRAISPAAIHEVVAKWEQVPCFTWVRSSADLPDRDLAEVLFGLQRLQGAAAGGDLRAYVAWSVEW